MTDSFCLHRAGPAAGVCLTRWLPLAAALAALPAGAQTAAELPQVVVTGSPTARAVETAPYALGVVGRDALRASGPMVNLSESLSQVPGVVVNNRANLAQDLQISSRGFGARAGFGVRGVRLYTDGIPASGPDGQGQVSHFDLANAQRVEVLRGPFSVLYGNSSGGVIALFTTPVTGPEAEAALDVGSDGLRQVRGSLGADLGGGFSTRVSLASMSTEGFRPHSAGERTLGNMRLGWQGERDQVTVLLNSIDQPAQDPLGLNREQFDTDPYSTAEQATTYNTRKTLSQTQLGASWRHAFDGGALRESQLSAYGGRRGVTQYLAIPPATQGAPRHGGGVVDFDRDYAGAEARLRWGWQDLDLVLGAALDHQRDDRQGYENFIGDTLGVQGALRRDERNRADTRDVFAQGEWALGAGLSASAGLRSGRVRLSADDAYLANGDDSGELSFSYTNPVLGLRWQATPAWQFHASVARGFEAPTLGEVAYRTDGTGGLNTSLKPQTSRQLELGSRWHQGALRADLTLFRVEAADEIGVMTNAGGRASYRNVGRTLRQGVELAGAWQPASGWRSAVALSWLDATYRDGFLACASLPCLAPSEPVAAGNHIAGAPQASAWAELAWRGAAWGEFGVEARGVGATAVNDLNSDFAAGYGLLALRWRKAYALTGGQRLELLARVDNLLDRRYAGSVIVNDSNGRFFETGAPRQLLLGLRLSTGR